MVTQNAAVQLGKSGHELRINQTCSLNFTGIEHVFLVLDVDVPYNLPILQRKKWQPLWLLTLQRQCLSKYKYGGIWLHENVWIGKKSSENIECWIHRKILSTLI